MASETEPKATRETKDSTNAEPAETNKASVLIRTRLRAPCTGLRWSDAVKGNIISTLIKLHNRGLEKNTLRNIDFQLIHLSKYEDLENLK